MSPYDLVVRGDGASMIRMLSDLGWIADVNACRNEGLTTLSVSVAEPETAAALLRCVLADDGGVVTCFDRKHFSPRGRFLALVDVTRFIASVGPFEAPVR